MDPKKIVGFAVLAGVIMTDQILSERHIQATISEQPHLEVSIENPITLDFSSHGVSGINTHSVTTSFGIQAESLSSKSSTQI
jgi:hypothetical protein